MVPPGPQVQVEVLVMAATVAQLGLLARLEAPALAGTLALAAQLVQVVAQGPVVQAGARVLAAGALAEVAPPAWQGPAAPGEQNRCVRMPL